MNTYKYNVDYINSTDVVSHFNVNYINTYVVNNDTDNYIHVIFFRKIEVENLFHDGSLEINDVVVFNNVVFSCI